MPRIHLGRQDMSNTSNQPDIFAYDGTASKVPEVALSKVTWLEEVIFG